MVQWGNIQRRLDKMSRNYKCNSLEDKSTKIRCDRCQCKWTDVLWWNKFFTKMLTGLGTLIVLPALYYMMYFARITPYSGRAIHVGPFHVDPIHVETDSCPIGPIHVRPFSCPTLFMFNMTDSCRPFSCRDRFMSVPIHVRPYSCPKVPFHVWPDSCLTLFMSEMAKY